MAVFLSDGNDVRYYTTLTGLRTGDEHYLAVRACG
jgi:hypothetical protein